MAQAPHVLGYAIATRLNAISTVGGSLLLDWLLAGAAVALPLVWFATDGALMLNKKPRALGEDGGGDGGGGDGGGDGGGQGGGNGGGGDMPGGDSGGGRAGGDSGGGAAGGADGGCGSAETSAQQV